MLTRILTAVVAVPLLIFLLYLDNTAVLLVAMTFAAALAVGEVLLATKYFSNKGVAAVCMIYATVMPTFLCIDPIKRFFPMLAGTFLLIMFVIMLFDHEKVRFEEIALMSFVSFLIPLSLSTIVFLHKNFETGVYYVVLALLIPWISDAGAYFIGSAFGKHKMAPKISPKKSWEGFIGGLVFCLAASALLAWLFPAEVKGLSMLQMLGFGAVVCVAGTWGDLIESMIKRSLGVKDSGNLLPGHGGILDRIDSLLLVTPAVALYMVCLFLL